VCDYVHLNPVRARMLEERQPLETFPWSSYPLYLQSPEKRPVWMCVLRLLGEWAIPSDSPAGRQQFALQMEARRVGEQEQQLKAVKSDGCLGSEAFRQELLAQVSIKRGLWHFGPELDESAEAKAQRIISSELNAMGMTEQDLERQPKGAPFKVDLALKLRAETTVTLGWIAQRLHMGKRGHLKHLLYWHNKVKKPPISCRPMKPSRSCSDSA